MRISLEPLFIFNFPFFKISPKILWTQYDGHTTHLSNGKCELALSERQKGTKALSAFVSSSFKINLFIFLILHNEKPQRLLRCSEAVGGFGPQSVSTDRLHDLRPFR